MSKDLYDEILDPHEAIITRIKSRLAGALILHIEMLGITQTEAARRCGVSQPRMSNLIQGMLSKFSIEALIQFSASLGMVVEVDRVGDEGSEVVLTVKKGE